MNKEELINAVYANKKASIPSKAAATRAVNAVLAGIQTGLRQDSEVLLVNFGTFRVKQRPARRGYHPGTGKNIRIKASKTVKFSCGLNLRATAKRSAAI